MSSSTNYLIDKLLSGLHEESLKKTSPETGRQDVYSGYENMAGSPSKLYNLDHPWSKW